MPIEIRDLLDRLDSVRETGRGQWEARCPCHEDNRASLSVGEGDDGKPLIYCHAGCKTAHVLYAVNLKVSDLFPSKKSWSSRIEKVYDYHNAKGDVVFQVVRLRDPKEFRQRKPDGKGGYSWTTKGVEKVLYRLSELEAADVVIICEGEKDVDRLRSLGFTATCNAGGAVVNDSGKPNKKWLKQYTQSLTGKHCVLPPDFDKPNKSGIRPGTAHVQYVAHQVRSVAASVKIIELPGLREGQDISDWLDAGHKADELREIIHATPEWQPPANESSEGENEDDGGDEEEENKKSSQATRLVEIATDRATLFHDDYDNGYASIPTAGHVENWPVRNSGFRKWLLREYWRECAEAPSTQAIQGAVNLLDGQALFDGPERALALRVAGDNRRIEIDLGDAEWSSVVVAPEGWQIKAGSFAELPAEEQERLADEAISKGAERLQNEAATKAGEPVTERSRDYTDRTPKFRRTKGMRPLPKPERGGDINDLWTILNVRESDRPLVLGWLLMALSPSGPYPLLCLLGEAGSAKSSATRLLRRLIDPAKPLLRREPRDERDLIVGASNSWVLTLDNLSRMPVWLSDSLCRLSTGGGFATRALYTDNEEAIFSATRPAIANGISELANRGDLVDRCLFVNLDRIPDRDRLTEEEINSRFDALAGGILGALLDALAEALRRLPIVRLDSLPRLADFARFVTAGELALGLGEGEFLAAYQSNRFAANASVLESSLVAQGIFRLLEKQGGRWEGTASELLADLEDAVSESDRARARNWPADARGLSGRMKRLAPNLRANGLGVLFRRESRKRTIALEGTLAQDDGNFASFVSSPDVTRYEPTVSERIKPDDDCHSSVTQRHFCVIGDANGDANDATMTQTADSGEGHLSSKNKGKSDANDANDANDAKLPSSCANAWEEGVI